MGKPIVKTGGSGFYKDAFIHNEDQSVAMMLIVRIDYDGAVRVHLMNMITDLTSSSTIGNIWQLSEDFSRDADRTLTHYFLKELKIAEKSVAGL